MDEWIGFTIHFDAPVNFAMILLGSDLTSTYSSQIKFKFKRNDKTGKVYSKCSLYPDKVSHLEYDGFESHSYCVLFSCNDSIEFHLDDDRGYKDFNIDVDGINVHYGFKNPDDYKNVVRFLNKLKGISEYE